MEQEKDIFYKLVEKAKTTTLTDRERSKLFMAVDAYVERNPIKIKASTPAEKAQVSPFAGVAGVAAGAKSGLKNASRTFRSRIPGSLESLLPVKSPFSFNFAFHSYTYAFRTAVALLVVVVLGTGTSFAAEGSLPGDLLYAVKVNVNEGMKSVFLSGVKETEYEIARAQKRVAEVKELIAENKLSPEVQTKIATNLSAHVSKVEKDVDALSKKGELKSAFEISSKLENSLVESEIEIAKIAKAKTETDVTPEATAQVAVQVAVAEKILQAPQKNSETVRETAEDQIYTRQSNDADTQTIAVAKLDSVKKTLALIEEKTSVAVIDASAASTDVGVVGIARISPKTVTVDPLISVDPAATTNATGSTEAGLEAADAAVTLTLKVTPTKDELVAQVNELIAAGEEKLAAQEYNEAFRLFREADRITETIEAEIDAQNAVDLPVIIDPEAKINQEIGMETGTGTDEKMTTLNAAEVQTATVVEAVNPIKTKTVEKKPQ